MNRHDYFVISLADQVNFLRTSYRDYVLRAMVSYPGHGLLPFQHFEYDGIEFMTELVKEISCMEQSPESMGQLPKSTEVLVRAGFDVKTATWLACEVFKSILDVIATYFPDAVFGPYENGWDFGFVNGCDLGVSKPSQHTPVPAAPIVYEPPVAVPGTQLMNFHSHVLGDELLPAMKTSAQIEAMQGMK